MSLKKRIPVATFAFLLITGYALAQRGDGGRTGSDHGGSDRGASSSSSSSSSVGHASSGSVVHSTGTASGGGGYIPTYGGSSGGYSNYYFANDSYYARTFLYGLWRQYPYFSLSNYAYRYDVGDSPIDRDLLRLALQDSYEAATAMVYAVNNLSTLIDQLEANQIDRKQFQTRFDTALADVKKMAKTIKKDARLEFLDQRKGVSTQDPPKAASIAEMRELVAQLSQQATAMRDGLENYYVRDYTRIVELDHLKQPSFKSISDRIEKLAKAIEKSADRL